VPEIQIERSSIKDGWWSTDPAVTQTTQDETRSGIRARA
jgi:hypothetical protein